MSARYLNGTGSAAAADGEMVLQSVRRTAPLNLNQGVNLATVPAPRLFMSNPVAMSWRPNGSDAWVVVQSSDLVVRLTVDGGGVPSIGAPLVAGPSQIVRVDLRAVAAGEIPGRAPRGIAINGSGTRALIRSNAADVSQAISPLGASGFNIPSLLGVHETAPYFHSGLAR